MRLAYKLWLERTGQQVRENEGDHITLQEGRHVIRKGNPVNMIQRSNCRRKVASYANLLNLQHFTIKLTANDVDY
jgi:hypothetical protein